MGSRQTQKMDSIPTKSYSLGLVSLAVLFLSRKGRLSFVTASSSPLVVRSKKVQGEELPLLNTLLCCGIAKEQETIGMTLML